MNLVRFRVVGPESYVKVFVVILDVVLGLECRFGTFVGNKLGIVACPVAMLPAFIVKLPINDRPFRNKTSGNVYRLFQLLPLQGS